mmetsp:Transcript_6643/g.10681  ORF Transcript_6643/g.10681 Transcript_6643/m.10681 type:complete len:86 (-) Transcript_6643:1065-1322(-)|eukprot:CAMPEP_0170505964 /NCGR_PEP_ID=MMETSP0208-20121228/53013_1 /TAXON_ID=197538 /ORGANISM="Strombidium inclinatum, Strain S3" /LENGTH=85 /DNA_ID=CAMNT_0010787167 /DNA_START=1174 /DNA_END=1431 /DNA_ORIENTATION=-
MKTNPFYKKNTTTKGDIRRNFHAEIIDFEKFEPLLKDRADAGTQHDIVMADSSAQAEVTTAEASAQNVPQMAEIEVQTTIKVFKD